VTATVDRPAVSTGDRRVWRRLAVRCALVPAAVLVPLVTLAPVGDRQFAVYWHGATVRSNPWMLFTDGLRGSQPLGRVAEWSADVVAYVLVEILRLPAEIALRLVVTVAAVLVTGAVVVFAEAVTARGRMFASPPARPFLLMPFAVAACLVAVDSAVNLLSAALMLFVAAWLCRAPRRAVAVVAAGLLLAVFNDVAAMAVPLVTVVLVMRQQFRPVALLWAGFLPAFVLLHSAWATPRLPDLPDVALPSMVVLVLAAVAFIVLTRRSFAELPELPVPDRSQRTVLVAAGIVLLLGPPVLVPASVALLVAVLPVQRLALAGLAFLAAGGAVANQSYAGAANREPLALVSNAIAGEIAQFDPTDAGDARRCELRDRFARLTAGMTYDDAQAAELLDTRTPAERLDIVLDMATVQMHGMPFCGRSL
jgi:hypothetical protein